MEEGLSNLQQRLTARDVKNEFVSATTNFEGNINIMEFTSSFNWNIKIALKRQ